MAAASSAFAGTWGSKKLVDLGKQLPSQSQTTYRTQFGDAQIKDAKAKARMPHSRFKSLQDNSTMILTYDTTGSSTPHATSGDSSVFGDEGSIGSHASASTFTMPEPADPTPVAMLRTQQKLLRTSVAPIAVGRSGHRMEKGINASGLLGERLQQSSEPTRNSFVQRSWLPYDDPALLYKVNGKPEAYMPNDVSLDVGSLTNKVRVGWDHGRRAVFTNGSKKSGVSVFMDE